MNETNYDTIFGRMALDQGLCNDLELKESLERMKHLNEDNPLPLQNIMIELGYITKTQAERLKNNITQSKAAAHQIPGYKILGKLGSGAMAIVYKAKQLSLNRTVAVKILPKRFSENPQYVERFYKEGQAAAKLNHNNIVQAIDVGEAGGYHFFVMEYVEGKTLYDDLSKGKIFSEQESIEIIVQIAEALKHAHERGLIHRDIKPKNIMIDKEGVVKVADMGLARETADIETAKTEAGKAYGTPYYIAPEQIRGEIDIDGRVDIYALGGTFYHMVTGRVPFKAENPADVMKKHLREEMTPPDHINTDLSAGVSEVIEIMMAKKKENRYANSEELLIDIYALRDGKSPTRAHQKFDISMLEKLEEGEDVEQEYQQDYNDEALTKYKAAVAILGTTLIVSLIIILLMIINR
ncbi:MAG: serine/threonine protein kinase [Planctomycetota bacterium]|jgi:serine/threonine-protein kinase